MTSHRCVDVLMCGCVKPFGHGYMVTSIRPPPREHEATTLPVAAYQGVLLIVKNVLNTSCIRTVWGNYDINFDLIVIYGPGNYVMNY